MLELLPAESQAGPRAIAIRSRLVAPPAFARFARCFFPSREQFARKKAPGANCSGGFHFSIQNVAICHSIATSSSRRGSMPLRCRHSTLFAPHSKSDASWHCRRALAGRSKPRSAAAQQSRSTPRSGSKRELAGNNPGPCSTQPAQAGTRTNRPESTTHRTRP